VQLITFNSLKKTLDSSKKTREHQMKWKNTRSSGKTQAVAPLHWQLPLIASKIWTSFSAEPCRSDEPATGGQKPEFRSPHRESAYFSRGWV